MGAENGFWRVVWDAAVLVGCLAALVVWAWAAVYLWQDGLRIFAGLIVASFVGGVALVAFYATGARAKRKALEKVCR